MKAKVFVTLKKGVLDPQGKAVTEALHALSFRSVRDVRQGKYFEIELDAKSADQANKEVGEMCDKLLANTVIEEYRFEIEE